MRSTESGLPIAIGIRADGGWDELGTWTIVGFAAGFAILFVKLESALVAAARAEAGRPPVRDAPDVTAPRGSGLRRVRRAVDFVPLFRLWHAVEATLLVLAAAVVDRLAGDLVATRVLAAAFLVAGRSPRSATSWPSWRRAGCADRLVAVETGRADR